MSNSHNETIQKALTDQASITDSLVELSHHPKTVGAIVSALRELHLVLQVDKDEGYV